MPTPQKEAMVETIVGDLRNAKSLVFADFRGLNVQAMVDLRVRCREAGVGFRVAKNTLSRRALSGVGMPEVGEALAGPTALAVATEDELAPARVLVDFARDNDKLKLKGGIMEGRVISIDEIKALASLPSRDVLIAQLLATFEAPVSQVVSAAGSLVNDILSCAEQVSERGKDGGATPAAAGATTSDDGSTQESDAGDTGDTNQGES